MPRSLADDGVQVGPPRRRPSRVGVGGGFDLDGLHAPKTRTFPDIFSRSLSTINRRPLAQKSELPGFKVAGSWRFQRADRAEIGSTTMLLRDILCGVLEEGLREMGTSFEFPVASELHENKGAFISSR